MKSGADGVVTQIQPVYETDVRINGGYFVLKQDIFRYLHPGEELVIEPFQRLIPERQLVAYQHNGFFACMDTFKDKQHLDDLYSRGNAPWEVWKSGSKAGGAGAAPDTAGSTAKDSSPAKRHA